jgi:hypothetical protein
MNPPRERWTFVFELPAGEPHGGRLVARALKTLWRAFGLRCTAILEAPPEVKQFEAEPGEDLAQH